MWMVVVVVVVVVVCDDADADANANAGVIADDARRSLARKLFRHFFVFCFLFFV